MPGVLYGGFSLHAAVLDQYKPNYSFRNTCLFDVIQSRSYICRKHIPACAEVTFRRIHVANAASLLNDLVGIKVFVLVVPLCQKVFFPPSDTFFRGLRR